MILIALAGTWLLVDHERQSVRRESIGRARAVMSAVDAELRGHISTIESIAASPSLASGDIRAFYEEARRTLATQSDWLNVGLTAADRQQLFDASQPYYEQAKPRVSDGPTFERAVKTGKVVIGNLSGGSTIAGEAVRIRVPIVEEGNVRYVLSVPLKPALFQEVLEAQDLPKDWPIAVVDANRRFIARLPVRPVGDPVSESFRKAIDDAPEGFYRGLTREGVASYTSYVTSPLSGWVLGFAMPEAMVEAGARRAIATMAFGGTAGVLVALALAFNLARRIADPVTSLATAAGAIGRGEQPPLETSSRIDEINQLQHALIAAADATRERERSLEREKETLQEVDRAKDEFLAMLSHELRNPLAALSSASHVLKLVDPSHEGFRQSRDIVERQTRHMSRLIGDLLDVSGVLMGKLSLSREPIELGQLVNTAIATYRQGSLLSSHALSIDASPVWVVGDRARLEQIFLNLFDNALKFTPRGNAIHVSVKRDGGDAVLVVKDDGEGFAREDAHRFFELFVQGEQGIDRGRGGMGIGLALVKRLTELHGGTVVAASAGPGQGANFVVRLPAIEAPRSFERSVNDIKPSTLDVLLVEDRADTRIALRAALEARGHRVREAGTGEEALEVAAHSRIKIALLDIGLPGIDGYELARRLRAIDSGIVLIALTGYGQPEDRNRATAAGFDRHLVKPVDMDVLERVIAEATQRVSPG